MTGINYEHPNVERFIVGTVGVPGERAFFLQIESPVFSNCVAIEKGQVDALSERFKEMIRELRRNKLASLDELALTIPLEDNTMQFPITEDFTVGLIGISWDQDLQRINLELQAFGDDPIGEEIEEDSESSLDMINASLRIYQVRNFCSLADKLISSGRQPCPFCGLPINAEGHLCPRSNGYRR
ncbi:MAG: DUF3090 family protein [Actinomycetes bacterium]